MKWSNRSPRITISYQHIYDVYWNIGVAFDVCSHSAFAESTVDFHLPGSAEIDAKPNRVAMRMCLCIRCGANKIFIIRHSVGGTVDAVAPSAERRW